jgi:hypothetical protein
MDRRYTNEECWKATLEYVNSAIEADRLGFDSFWTTEHHFQYEGYEVIPNGLQISTWIAAQTTRTSARRDVQRGAAVEPAAPRRGLRHAAQPVGRARHARRRTRHRAARGAAPQRQGRVDRVARQPRPGDRRLHNREVFEESMEIIRRALTQESLLVPGQALPDPGPGHPRPGRDRAGRSRSCRDRCTRSRSGRRSPARPRSTTSPSSATAPCSGTSTTRSSSGSGTSTARSTSSRTVSTLAAREADARRRGAHRGHVREGRASARPGHDEFWKFLGPYGWSRGYMGEDGKPAKPGLIPTLDESIENKTILSARPSRSPRACSSTRTCSVWST